MDGEDARGYRAWFDEYAAAVNRADAGRIASQYADCYIEAGPRGSGCLHNDSAYRAALDEKSAAMKAMGFELAEITAVSATPISADYDSVRVGWRLRFASAGKALFAAFDQTYIVRHLGAEKRVVCYVSHADEAEEMQKLGLGAVGS
jgi:hypothetical protein